MNDSGLTSDRLRKAIERNRAKQAKRSQTSSFERIDVARADTQRFSSEFRAKEKKSPGEIKYIQKSTTKKVLGRERKKIDETFLQKILASQKVQQLGTYLGYSFIGFLVVRLIFSQGGILDYYNTKADLEVQNTREQALLGEMKLLEEEINLIKTDTSYQKKMVRDHLGFIAADEYMILFPTGKDQE